METGGREGDIQAAHESVRTLTWLLRDRKPWKGFEQRSCNGLPQTVMLWTPWRWPRTTGRRQTRRLGNNSSEKYWWFELGWWWKVADSRHALKTEAKCQLMDWTCSMNARNGWLHFLTWANCKDGSAMNWDGKGNGAGFERKNKNFILDILCLKMLIRHPGRPIKTSLAFRGEAWNGNKTLQVSST